MDDTDTTVTDSETDSSTDSDSDDQREPPVTLRAAEWHPHDDHLQLVFETNVAHPSPLPIQIEIRMGEQWRRIPLHDERPDDTDEILVSEFDNHLTTVFPKAYHDGDEIRVRVGTQDGREVVVPVDDVTVIEG